MACSPIEGEFSEDRWPTGTSFDTKICHIGLNRKRLSLAKRTAIGLARFLLVNGIGVAATLAWQSYGDEIREFVAKSYPQLAWVAPETAFAKAAPAGPCVRYALVRCWRNGCISVYPSCGE